MKVVIWVITMVALAVGVLSVAALVLTDDDFGYRWIKGGVTLLFAGLMVLWMINDLAVPA